MAQVDPPNENGSAIGCCQVWASLLAQSVQLPLGLGEGPAPGVAVAPAGAEIAAKNRAAYWLSTTIAVILFLGFASIPLGIWLGYTS